MSPLVPPILVLLLGAGPAPADQEKAASRPAEIAAHFHDGTIVHGAFVNHSIEITTRYGKLAVPVADVRRVEFGHRVPPEVAQKIEEAIKRLGSDQFAHREAAGKELIALGTAAYPAVFQATKSTDQEVSRRALIALEKIQDAAPDQDWNFRTTDVIYTSDCTLTGRIGTSTLKAQTQKFGELQFKLADLKAVYSLTTASADLAVEAAQFSTTPDKWFDTALAVEAGVGMVVKASGKVDLAPQQAGQIVSGPEGCPNAGMNMGFAPGTLLGRIGEKGDVFVIGKRHEIKTSRAGNLYVFIVPVQGGNPPTGSFKVKATAGYGVAVNPARNTSVPNPRNPAYGFPGAAIEDVLPAPPAVP